MIAAEIQLRDEQLTSAGHDPECAAFDDKECSCEVAQSGPVMRAGKLDHVLSVARQPGSVTLTGASAAAFQRYRAATVRLQQAQLEMKDASAEFNAAHQAFADAIAAG